MRNTAVRYGVLFIVLAAITPGFTYQKDLISEEKDLQGVLTSNSKEDKGSQLEYYDDESGTENATQKVNTQARASSDNRIEASTQRATNKNLQNITSEEEREQKGKQVKTTSTQIQKSSIDAISIKVLRGEENGIAVSDLVLSKQIPFLNQSHLKAFSVDYHYNKRLIFYSALDKVYRDRVVGRLTRTGVPQQVVSMGVDGPISLAVDWVHDRLYWFSNRHGTLEVSDLDGGNRSLIFDSFPDTIFPNNIALDPYKGYIFFVSNHSIYRSSLDGNDLTLLGINYTEPRPVKCLTVDIHNKRLYFSGKLRNWKSGVPYVSSSNYDGQEVKNIILSNKWNDIFSISVFRNVLYFAHFQEDQPDSFWSADLSNAPVNPVRQYSARDIKSGLWSIRVYHPGVQKESEDNTCPEKSDSTPKT